MVLGSVSDRFCAPGLGASSPNCQAPLSRSSFACPIVAGIAALVLEFALQEPLQHDESVHWALMTTQGMTKILQKMSSQGVGHESFKILCS